MENKNYLLTWDSYNHGFIVTAKTILGLLENENILINEVLYLHNQQLTDQNIEERKAFFKEKSDSKSTIDRERLSKVKRVKDQFELQNKSFPKFRNKGISIKNVTHYQSIYDALVQLLKSDFSSFSGNLHINVSPGTPQMHVVWLMLNASGYLPENTKLWSSQWSKADDSYAINEIKFKPKTYLSEVLKRKFNDEFTPLINPNDTRSGLRKEAENRIKVFAHLLNVPILLLGERGTGKSTYVREVIAPLHTDLPYKELACGTFNEELLRGELFGYTKGAFTGANRDKQGILAEFEKGGVLFLDEIQDLSKPLQRQLIQVLQTGQYYPLGSKEPRTAKFRLITASNKSFQELNNTYLDLDFVDRIARFIVEIPALRKSREDLSRFWIDAWKSVHNGDDGITVIISAELDKFLAEDPLYGNFRDLQRLAALVGAFYLSHKNQKTAVKDAISEFKRWSTMQQPVKSNDILFEKDKDYNHIVAHFNKELVTWAESQYGSLQEASKVLKRSESALRKDKSMERLYKQISAKQKD
ncbi:sigma 54-interacting transcriptional regulator [Tenacibaculum maritimum]|uniref:sigma 54-interacting transcriptional regulator n=1 Tax=Tenacibaculum maritimum TaxID=107401 RepID=UPI00388E4050